jgi:mRNA-degrading endonuclease RelE of RelBE toxin-antitoxin system
MRYNIELLPKAEIEYKKAYRWYEEQLIGLGDRFETSVERKLNNISNNPLFYPNKGGKLRECKVDDFPFLIIFRVYSEKNLIFVYSIFHTSRRPGKKYKKSL